MAKSNKRVIVVGGGLAGLAAAVRIAEAGEQIDLFSLVPVKRSHSVCAQGGINACTEPVRQEGFSEWNHFDETLYGGDFLNHQPPVYEMTHWAPQIIEIMDRMGVPFNRTAEGNLDRRYFGGSLFRRTHFAGASTGQQLLYALDEQTRRYEAAGKVTKYEFWEFLWPVIDEQGACRGIVAQDVRTMEIKAFPADAVVMATGGCGVIFGKSTMSVFCNGAAAARCYQAGAHLGNPEMIQVHPTAIPGEDKCRLMSESARGEGGRVWVPRKKGDERDPRDIPENERWYFLEERYPEYGNLVSRDVATRNIFDVVQNGYGLGGGRMVYLDITHLPQETKNKLHAILEIYEKFTGDDPREVPMKIFPAVHYSMGGMYTIYETEQRRPDRFDEPENDHILGMKQGAPKNMMTNVPGLYAFGEVNYQYHGATRLGANALLNCIFDGLFCGPSVVSYIRDEVETPACELDSALFNNVVEQERTKQQHLVQNEGGENPYELHREMGDWMNDRCTVVKVEQDHESGQKGMADLYDRLQEWKQRYKKVSLADTGMWTNQNLSFTRALGDMIKYADAIVLASIERKESRGSHYRLDYPERNDAQFLKTAVAKYDASADQPILEWEDVPQPMVAPRARTYGKVEKDAKGQGDAQQEQGQASVGAESKPASSVADCPSVAREDKEQGKSRTDIQ